MLTAILTALSIVLVLSALLLCTALGLAGGGLALLSEASARRRMSERMAGSRCVSGTVTDMRIRQAGSTHRQPPEYQYAVQFPDSDSSTRTALLSIRTAQELPYRTGDTIPLRILPQPVLTAAPGPAAVPEDGKLPQQVPCCAWMNKPVDSTGTVMPELDYQALTEESGRAVRRGLLLGRILLSGACLTLLIGGAAAISLWRSW